MRGLPDQFLASWAVKVGINDLQGTGTECMRRAAKRRSKALGLPASLSPLSLVKPIPAGMPRLCRLGLAKDRSAFV